MNKAPNRRENGNTRGLSQRLLQPVPERVQQGSVRTSPPVSAVSSRMHSPGPSGASSQWVTLLSLVIKITTSNDCIPTIYRHYTRKHESFPSTYLCGV